MNKNLADNPRLGDWIRLDASGRITIATGKVELGQGILTALAEIAAHELDASPSSIAVISGDTDAAPDEGYTAGSLSIETSGAVIRAAAADLRAQALRAAAGRLKCSAEDLSLASGRILRDGRECGLNLGQLAAEIDFDQPIASGQRPAKPTRRALYGRDARRFDLPLKLAGGGFIHDLVFDDMLHARVLRAPRRGARLIAVDEEKTAASGRARCIRVGDFFAVAARSEREAELAAARARRSAIWDGGDTIPDEAGALNWLQTQESQDRVVEIGEPFLANESLRIVEATYARPFLAHASIGPACALARLSDGRLTVWTHSQGVFPLRDAIARALTFDPKVVRVIHQHGAGCYGHNGADDAAFDAALIATRCPGLVVRVLWSREDELSAAPFGAAMATRIRAEIDGEGRPTDWTTEIWSPPHARRPGMNGGIHLLGADALPDQVPPPPAADLTDAAGGGASRNALAIYTLPRQRLVHHMLVDQPVRTSSLRALGAFANVFAIESFIDELADAAGRDPLDYRLALLADIRARRVIERVRAMSNWDANASIGDGRAKGLGFARYKNRGAYCAVVVEVEVDDEIRLSHAWCVADAGLIINPDGARNQIEGGIVQAASWTLREAVRFEDGRSAAVDFQTYPLLRFSDIPRIDVLLIDADDEASVGVGEAAAGPTAAAIGNATARALGARIRTLPLSRAQIVAALA